MHKQLLLLAVLASSAAFATTPAEHNPTPPPTTPPPVVQPQNQWQGQLQGQQMRQGQSLRSSINSDTRSRADAQSRSASRSGVQGSGNATLNTGNGFGGGDDNRVVIHPGMIPPSPMAMNPQGNLAVMGTGCGPLINPTSEQVYATEPGVFSSGQVANGRNIGIAGPKIGPMGELILYDYQKQADGSTVVIGNQLIIGMSITNQSGGANIAAGVIRSSGSGAQVGGGASAAMQQMGERVIAVPCIAAILPARAPDRIVFQGYIPPRKAKPRPRVAPGCIPQQRICRADRN